MKRLDIAGHGLHRDQMTPEVRALAEAADIVFFLVSDAVVDMVPNAERVDWRPMYRNARPYAEIYGEMVDSVFRQGSWERGLILVEGNAAFFTFGVVPQVMKEARRRRWEVHMHASLSCFDAILTDLELQVARHGLQLVDGAAMAAGKHPIHGAMGCLILQPSLWSGPETFVQPPPADPEAYRGLSERLLETYPADHPLFIVESAMDPQASSLIVRSTVGTLPQHAAHISHFASIYLPPVG